MVLGSTLTFKVSTIVHSVIYPSLFIVYVNLIQTDSLGPRRFERLLEPS
jgi:hypothetical protein